MGQPQQHLFVSNRNFTLRSTLGLSITFEKGKPQHVPEKLHKLAIERGVMPCDSAGKPLPEEGEVMVQRAEEETKVKLPPDDGDVVRKDVLEAIEAIVKRNSPADFAGGGMPAPGAVSAAIGYKVDQKTVRGVLEKERARILGGAKE